VDAVLPLVAAAALLIAVVALVLALGVAVRVRELESRSFPPREGLPRGAEAPREPLTALLGGQSAWLDHSVLIFGSTSCQPCRELVTELNERAATVEWPIIVVESGPAADGSLADLISFARATRVADSDGAVRTAFRAHATPHTFLVREGRVADQQLGADAPRVLGMLSDDQAAGTAGA
jgi:hypothetical protein